MSLITVPGVREDGCKFEWIAVNVEDEKNELDVEGPEVTAGDILR